MGDLRTELQAPVIKHTVYSDSLCISANMLNISSNKNILNCTISILTFDPNNRDQDGE